MTPNFILAPSLMCADLVNLESAVHQLEQLGFHTFHIDIIDGQFAPSMPLGLDTVARLRAITDADFDIHLMSVHNEFFIPELLKIGVQNITFHWESSLHVEHYLNLIHSQGVQAGIALNPATPVSVLNYVLDHIEKVTVMLINPGFAQDAAETRIPYALSKIQEMAQLLQQHHLTTQLQVDGRVSLDFIPQLIAAGANNLVLGNTGLFLKGKTLAESQQLLVQTITPALQHQEA